MTEQRLAEKQLTQNEAVAMAAAGEWKTLTPAERGLFQLRQELLCMDFSAVHEGMEELLGRSVWTHEFADPDALWAEYLKGEPISFADVIAKLPLGKPIVAVQVQA